jgi:hypothetical protein
MVLVPSQMNAPYLDLRSQAERVQLPGKGLAFGPPVRRTTRSSHINQVGTRQQVVESSRLAHGLSVRHNGKQARRRGTSSAIPFWAQGDEAMETPEAQAERRALRHHPLVLDALKAWWTTTDLNGDGQLQWNEYCVLSMNMYKAIHDVWDPVDAKEHACVDWNRDRKGRDEISSDGCHKISIRF